MPWSPHRSQPGPDLSQPEPDRQLDLIAKVLDPVLVPLGFTAGQVGVDGDRGQVTFCRGEVGSTDGGCIDLVVDVEATPDWRVVDVRYWGFSSDRWHLDVGRGGSLADQLDGLARSLPYELGPKPMEG